VVAISRAPSLPRSSFADVSAREYKQEYYRGPCKIERKRERNGEYKEATKCKGYR
jgi:hypothetical protein